MHWQTAEELRIQLQKKQEPYVLCGIGGIETSYNKGMVTKEPGLIHIKFNGQNRRENFDITDLGDHQIILGRRWLKKENPWINWKTGTVRIRKETLKATATTKEEERALPKHQPWDHEINLKEGTRTRNQGSTPASKETRHSSK